MSDNTFQVQRPNWLGMGAGAFAGTGTQLGMTFGDGYGTLDILEAAVAVSTAPALEAVPAADGGLFALTLEIVTAAPAADGMLF